MTGPVKVGSGREQIQQRNHREDRTVHGIVHSRGVAGVRVVNHVTDKGQDKKGEDELFFELVSEALLDSRLYTKSKTYLPGPQTELNCFGSHIGGGVGREDLLFLLGYIVLCIDLGGRILN